MAFLEELDVPDSFDLTDVLDYTPSILGSLYEKFKSDKNRGWGFKKTVTKRFENFEGMGPGQIKIIDDKEKGTITRWVPDMGSEWVEEQNLKFQRAEAIMNAPIHLAPLFAPFVVKSTPSHVVLQKGNVKQNIPITRGGQNIFQQRHLNRYKKLFTGVDESLTISNAFNVTDQGLLSGTVRPVVNKVSGIQNKGALQSKEGALQTRISQFQAGISKSTRDLNLTTEFAKGSVLKEVPYTQVREKLQIQQQRFRETGRDDIANKMYRIDIALMNGNLYEAKKLAKNIKINSREIQTLPTASISDKRGYIDMKGGEIVQRSAQKSTPSPGNIAPPRGGLLTSKVDEVLNNNPLNISQFKNVQEIEAAKIQYQKLLDMFRLTELGIRTLEDAYNYYGINRSLSGFNAPPGYAVRPKGTVNVENQTGLTLVSKPIRDLERIKRGFPQEFDESSILPLFQNAVGQDKAPAEVVSYINTSKKIYNEIGKAITRYNKEQGRTVLTKEHIFDVDFHNKLQEIVPDFSGKGANELGNISILNLSLNSSTGARAGAIKDKTVDPETGAVDYPSVTNALIKNVQEGVGVDYNKSVGDFVYYDIGNQIKNFSKQDWDWLLKEIIDSQDTGRTVQDILVESMKNLQNIEDALSY